MKKRYILFIILGILFCLLGFPEKSYATDLDRIINYEITVDPNMNDGSLDIIYEITWKVLDSTTQGPLEWVEIGTPNQYFTNPVALSSNIKSISKYNYSSVKVVFDKKYYAGENITFKYKIHQPYMYKISGGKCNYEFTPAWFTETNVDNLTVKWNKDKVVKSDSKSQEDNYLVWNKKNMGKGSKMTVKVKYNKNSFSYLDSTRQNKTSDEGVMRTISRIIVVIVVIVILTLINKYGGGGYYSHRGFYGGSRYYGGGCVSSCACAHSSCASSCACACAGSGRAGCSKKDFYGTKLDSKKLKEVLEEKKKE